MILSIKSIFSDINGPLIDSLLLCIFLSILFRSISSDTLL